MTNEKALEEIADALDDPDTFDNHADIVTAALEHYRAHLSALQSPLPEVGELKEIAGVMDELIEVYDHYSPSSIPTGDNLDRYRKVRSKLPVIERNGLPPAAIANADKGAR